MLPGVPEACAQLRALGIVTVVVTNQPDIAYGQVAASTVEAINDSLRNHLGLDAFYVCPHGAGDDCICRKPRPGMLLEAAADHSIDLSGSWIIGDRWVDIAAGRAAGVRTVLIERPGSWSPTGGGRPPADLLPDARVDSLLEAVQLIVSEGSTGT
jgi:D-glycero-D-manno-heptose 1,7-bisphosphate phosphatase